MEVFVDAYSKAQKLRDRNENTVKHFGKLRVIEQRWLVPDLECIAQTEDEIFTNVFSPTAKSKNVVQQNKI
jgi:hypothetical protein